MKNLGIVALSLVVAGFSPLVLAVNNAASDVDTITLRMSCTENAGATEIPNCFNSMSAVDNWLRTVRVTGPGKPTLVNIGPGVFSGWECNSSNVTLQGSGRDRTVFTGVGLNAAMAINDGCTDINIQDMTFDSKTARWGVFVTNVGAVTSWANVEIIGQAYGWDERIVGSVDGSGTCPNRSGKHMWFSSRIRTANNSGSARAYTARCAQSWFWGSEVTAEVKDINTSIAVAIKADQAEIHLYGSNARLLLPGGVNGVGYQSPNSGQFLMAAINGSSVHIHGTGLDVMHDGAGIADMLYADATSHFHANESGFNIHLGGSGKVRRLVGAGVIEAPYLWGQSTIPPLSTSISGVQALISRNGADRYIETDCPLTGHCGSAVADKTYPHEMIYRAECTGTTPTTGPWFDLTTRACRQ